MNQEDVVGPPWTAVEDAVRAALAEDVGLAGDITTAAIIDTGATARAAITFREEGVLAGTWTTDAVCAQLDLMVSWRAEDGDTVGAGIVAGELEGAVADILTAERTILNFLMHLSGIATLTKAFVRVAGPDVTIRDTRKTTPGLRALEKAAVRAGGGVNHRMGLFDAILIKDNHVAATRMSMADLVERAAASYPGVVVEVEVETVEQARAVAEAGADVVLLDNMSPGRAGEAVGAIAGGCLVEISGGLTLENIAEYAKTGADFLAVGALTHSAPSVDIGIDVIVDEEV